jgi:AcrR family transcriptional regulator
MAAMIHAAAVVFDVKGYAGASISDIAHEMGMTNGALYFHFESKADLAKAVGAELGKAWGPILARQREKGLTGLDALQWTSEQLAVLYRDDIVISAAVRLVRENALIYDEEEIPTPFIGWTEYAKECLDYAKGAGQIAADVDTGRISWLIVSFFYGLQEVSLFQSGRADIEDRLADMWALVRAAIAA